jgi:DUF4097 and DUF4098 domain-containing protein YvlB
MKTLLHHRFAIALLLVAAAPNGLVAATERSDLTKTFPVSPGGTLMLDADRGSIDIVTGNRSAVVIQVERSLSKVDAAKAREIFADHEVTFAQDGDRVGVTARFKHPQSGSKANTQNRLQVHYRVEVPAKFNLDLKTGGGEITCSDIEGAVKARTSGGHLTFARVTGAWDGNTSGGNIRLASASGVVSARTSGGSITLGNMMADTTAETSGGHISVQSAAVRLLTRTSGGSIDLEEVDGPTEARTSGGSIHVKTAGNHLVARTSGGRIAVDNARASVDVQSSGGSVSVQFTGQPERDCQISTSAGDVVVKLPETLGLELEARTSAGKITTEIPVTSTVIGKADPEVLKGKLNGGGPRLLLKTSAGDVVIQKR